MSTTLPTDKAEIIKAVCQALGSNDAKAVDAAANRYPFIPLKASSRGCAVSEAIALFARDGFIDRYSGERLVNPAVLRVLSNRLPALFPFQKNWKMSQTHVAYWELVPTIDHLIPVARGGHDHESNWVTTSMVRNSAKSNWTLEELGWTLLPPGDLKEWDGLSQWLIRYVEEHGESEDPYIMRWYKASRALLL